MNRVQLWWCDVTDWWDYKFLPKLRDTTPRQAFACLVLAGIAFYIFAWAVQ